MLPVLLLPEVLPVLPVLLLPEVLPVLPDLPPAVFPPPAVLPAASLFFRKNAFWRVL